MQQVGDLVVVVVVAVMVVVIVVNQYKLTLSFRWSQGLQIYIHYQERLVFFASLRIP